jgi:aspartate aminotransferase-like enzyme
MINHRSSEMGEIVQRITRNLQSFLCTEREFLLLTTSGSGGLEAAVVNTVSSGDRVLGADAGAFGNRFCSVAQTYGVELKRLELEWGQAVCPEHIGRALRDEPETRAVLLTHNETSTGVTHPLEKICHAIREESNALILVDAVSSLGAVPLPMDDWGIDLVVTGSQKAWGAPPGLAMIGVGPRVWEAHQRSNLPRFFFDLARYRNAERSGFPYTPAVSVFYGLDEALALMVEEGAEAVYARHARIGARVRSGIRSMGLSLLADERFASNTVTAVNVPRGVDGKELARVLREKYDTVLGGGQAHFAGRIFRIGHMGWVTEEDVDHTLGALEHALSDLSYHPDR